MQEVSMNFLLIKLNEVVAEISVNVVSFGCFRLRNGVKFCKVQSLPEVSDHISYFGYYTSSGITLFKGIVHPKMKFLS